VTLAIVPRAGAGALEKATHAKWLRHPWPPPSRKKD